MLRLLQEDAGLQLWSGLLANPGQFQLLLRVHASDLSPRWAAGMFAACTCPFCPCASLAKVAARRSWQSPCVENTERKWRGCSYCSRPPPVALRLTYPLASQALQSASATS